MTGPVPGSANAAVEVAALRAAETAGRNLPELPDLPLPSDTANLRLGEVLSDALLALLPLVGVWRGEGQAEHPDRGQHAFGEQITVAHNGGDFLTWEARSWRLDADGQYAGHDLREVGFWRVTGEGEAESIELLLAHSTGVAELFYGAARNATSWELATDVVIRANSAPVIGGASRLYGLVEGGDLAYVEERSFDSGELAPHRSARLRRYIG